MKAQLFSMAILMMLIPFILFVLLLVSAGMLINAFKLPVIAIASILVYAIMYKLMIDVTKSKEIRIGVSILLSLLTAYAMYVNWVYMIVGFMILIPTYGIIKELYGSPIKGIVQPMYVYR